MKPPTPPPSAAAAPENQRRRGDPSSHADGDDPGTINRPAAPTPAGDSATASSHEEEGKIAAAVLAGWHLTPKAVPGTMAILLQNCDLPPPQKLFGPDDLVTSLAAAGKPNFLSSSPIKPKPCLGEDQEVTRLIRDAIGENKVGHVLHKDNHHPCVEDVPQEPVPQLGDGGRNENDTTGTGGLLKAMRLSQTRAREAEAKASQLTKTTQRMALLLLDESMRLHAYRQWVRLLQAEIATLENRRSDRGDPVDHAAINDDDEEEEHDVVDGSGGGSGVDPCTGNSRRATWMAWAVVLAVAGVGLAVGCKYLF